MQDPEELHHLATAAVGAVEEEVQADFEPRRLVGTYFQDLAFVLEGALAEGLAEDFARAHQEGLVVTSLEEARSSC